MGLYRLHRNVYEYIVGTDFIYVVRHLLKALLNVFCTILLSIIHHNTYIVCSLVLLALQH